jgi:hypothetical protein
MKLWLANFDPRATDDELREVVHKYNYKKTEVVRLTRRLGDDARPGAVLEFDEGSLEALGEAQRRLSGLYWKFRSGTGYVPL